MNRVFVDWLDEQGNTKTNLREGHKRAFSVVINAIILTQMRLKSHQILTGIVKKLIFFLENRFLKYWEKCTLKKQICDFLFS
jgi:hypothetical protein